MLTILLFIGIVKGQKSACQELRDICKQNCPESTIFSFLEVCEESVDEKIIYCSVPSGCDCEIPERLQSSYSTMTSCQVRDCNVDWGRLIPSSRAWCQACADNCDGFQQDCINNGKFCRINNRCAGLDMCKNWRIEACSQGLFTDETCDGESSSPTVSPTLIPTISPTVSPTLVPTVSPTIFPMNVPTIETTSFPTVEITISSSTLIPTISSSTISPTIETTISPTIENMTKIPEESIYITAALATAFNFACLSIFCSLVISCSYYYKKKQKNTDLEMNNFTSRDITINNPQTPENDSEIFTDNLLAMTTEDPEKIKKDLEYRELKEAHKEYKRRQKLKYSEF